MKKNNRFLILLFSMSLFVSFSIACISGCASLQKDVVMTTDSFVQDEDVADLTRRFAELDAKAAGNEAFAGNLQLTNACDQLIKDIEQALKDSGMNAELKARLYAIEGLICFIQNKKPMAKRLYNTSLASNKGDSYTAILGSRLELVTALDDVNVISASNQSALLQLERGLNSYIKGNYTEAVAQLDSAFLSLPEFYKESYSEIRQRAWNLRGNVQITENAAVLSILNKSQITVSEMALITQETTTLLTTMNGGNKYSENELFTRLKDAGYFDPASSLLPEKKNVLKKNQAVTRFLCARFLWNIYCERKDYSSQKNKYSTRYRMKKGYSPIPDVEITNEDFDAIIGVVEHELMSLTDGTNFNPDELVSASQFNSFVQKIR